jgi:DNA-directed RNA polymerase subunit M/transcription elongation factor TFIIS
MARTSTASPSRTHVPLGSLTQPGARAGASCRACGSERVTRIAMNLTDGSPVEFTSCHHCEHRTWAEQGSARALPVDHVLDRTRKV